MILKKLNSKESSIEIWKFYDESFNIVSGLCYGKQGILNGIIEYGKYGENVYHNVEWVRSKQRRVIQTSYGEGNITRSDAENRR